MSVLVLVLTLMFGRQHVYAGTNVGVLITAHCGFEVVGDPGPFCTDDQ